MGKSRLKTAAALAAHRPALLPAHSLVKTKLPRGKLLLQYLLAQVCIIIPRNVGSGRRDWQRAGVKGPPRAPELSRWMQILSIAVAEVAANG